MAITEKRPPVARMLAAAAFALALLLSLQSRAAEAPIVVASKIDTEGALLGELIAAVIERKGRRSSAA